MACVVNMEVDIKDVCPVQHTDRKYGETHARNCKHLCSSIFSTSHTSDTKCHGRVFSTNLFSFRKHLCFVPFVFYSYFVSLLSTISHFILLSCLEFLETTAQPLPEITLRPVRNSYRPQTQEETMCHKRHKDLWQ